MIFNTINKLILKFKACILETKEKKESVYKYSIGTRLYYSIKLIILWYLTCIGISTILKFTSNLKQIPPLIILAGAYVASVGLLFLGVYIMAIILCMFSPLINKYLNMFE